MKFEYKTNGGNTVHTVETNNEWDMHDYISNKHIRSIDMAAFRCTNFTPDLLKRLNRKLGDKLGDSVETINNNAWYTFSILSGNIVTIDFAVSEIQEELDFIVKIQNQIKGL